MRKLKKAGELPGKGNPHNLVPSSTEGYSTCPCCGALWYGSKPWSESYLTVHEFASRVELSPQAVTSRIRSGALAAYPSATGRTFIIPVFEMDEFFDDVSGSPDGR
jgi:hypothetical protein